MSDNTDERGRIRQFCTFVDSYFPERTGSGLIKIGGSSQTVIVMRCVVVYKSDIVLLIIFRHRNIGSTIVLHEIVCGKIQHPIQLETFQQAEIFQ